MNEEDITLEFDDGGWATVWIRETVDPSRVDPGEASDVSGEELRAGGNERNEDVERDGDARRDRLVTMPRVKVVRR